MPERHGADRLWTVPNLLSASRLVLVAIFISLLSNASDRFGPGIVLAVAGITDFFDGQIARRFNQVTNFGKLLDPVVDRVVVASAVIAIAVDHVTPIWVPGVVLIRELVILLASVFLRLAGVREMDVLPIGKVGTFGLMVAFPIFVATRGASAVALDFRDIAWVIFVPALLCSWAAAAAYVPAARRAVAAARTPTLEPGAS